MASAVEARFISLPAQWTKGVRSETNQPRTPENAGDAAAHGRMQGNSPKTLHRSRATHEMVCFAEEIDKAIV
jgi:hypothetical protein